MSDNQVPFATLGNAIGFVTKLDGSVTVQSVDGQERVVKLGDPIFFGETVLTGGNGSVTMSFVDGTNVAIGEGSAVEMTDEVYNAGDNEDLVADSSSEVDALQSAILAGDDPTLIQDAPAAGSALAEQQRVDVSVDRNDNSAQVGFGSDTLRSLPTYGYDTDNSIGGQGAGREYSAPSALNRDSAAASNVADQAPLFTNTNDNVVNQAPLFTNTNDNVIEDDNVSGTLTATDIDLPAGAQLVFSSAASFTGFTLSSNGNYEFDASSYDSLKLGETEIVVIPVTVTDDQGSATTANLTIRITGTNDNPIVQSSFVTMNEESLITGQITASDADLPVGETLTFSTTSTAEGLVLNTDGSYSFDTSSYDFLAAGQAQFITIPVIATDELGATGTASLRIRIVGVNDAPTVDTNVGSTQVENLAQAGETVATFTASDLDGDDITFSITSGNDNGYFEILDNTSGVVTLTEAGETALANNALTETDYSLGVTANDGTVDSAEAFATITFDGVNDAPTVDTNVGSTQVENLAQAGETVATFTASDLDGDDITFSITSGNDNGYFEILDNTSGVVTLTEAGETALANNALTETDYSLGVTANDGTVDSAEAFATITFDGVNDAPTVDTNVGSTQVENLAQAGETVATFTASDLDGDDITFSITSGNDNGYFEILDNTSGVVTLTEAGETALANNALTETDYSLGVTANDGTVDSAEAFATITFDGVNDAPTVDTNVGSTQVENLAQAGETVATFTASDLDGDDITFSITSGNDNGYFEILDNTSGVVTLTEAGETALANNALTETDYSLGVTANDGTVDSAEAFATITFDGVNDAPTVDTNVGSTQVENLAQAGETVATFTASDLDGDDITFSITSGNDNGYFEILDNTSGVVTLTEAGETALANNALTETDYSLGVTANDGTVDSAEAFATITFDGVNDAPTVDTNVGSTQVENLAQAGETVATFTASDLDGDDITFSITSGNDNGYFEILDNTSGVVTLTEAGETALANNALTETDYSLGVTANDGTVDSAEAFATITFDGVNDAPTVDTNVGSTQVENLAQAGETVATFTASDLDGDDITFSITSGNDNGYFEILDNTSGVVTLTEAGETALANNALTETDYSLGVTANDGTVDSAEAFATITFDGVNDAPTVDTNVGSTQVENLAQAGETVATFTASDLDGDDITFSITSGNDNGYFEILDNTSGVVTLTEAGETALANNALTETDYSLGVTANDGTVDSAEAFATITFDGVNDAPTVDTNVGSTQVENLAQAGETVATFTASDLDGDDITFSITSGNDNGYFEILDNTSGVVTLTEAGETALANNALTETDYSLGVTANDGTVDSAEAFATITFDGVNDAPTVDTNVGSTQVENLAQAGETVATFTASDLDGDDITFSITSGNDNGYFEILDNTSGVVTLTEAGETALANNALTETDYSLGVTANDGTVDSAEAFATITFDGVNDAPTVDTNVGSTQVENLAQAGETVATFTASDLDGDDITFSITSGNDNGYFEILDNTSGVVTLTEAGETALANNALTETDYSLGVTANDGTVDSAEAFATITFDGVNDAPTVDTNVGSTQVENLAQAGETVATFTASDLDGDDITFSITSGNDNGYFEILDNTSGVVTLTEAGETALANNALTETDYSLGVTANDGTVDSAEAFATITFDGVNDAPTVDTNVGSTQVENLAQAGETVATFTASDLDGDDITFSITSGNDNGYFEILDNTSGVVTLTEAGETALANNALTETDYSLGVTANDGTVDSAEAFATITFDGVNDAPTVDTNVGSTQVENLAQAGETVATFTASDLDGDDITFSITSGNDNGYFEILDNTSGVVTLTEAGETALANNALTETDYSLGVTANDGTVDSAEAFATITFDGVNDAPTVDTNVGSTQVENLAQAGETVATFTASDLDGDDITFSITSGNDNGYFEILDNTSGVVTLTEAGETALANNALTETDYSLGVTANDGTVDSAEAFATITFDGVNDAPTVDTNVGSTQVENLAQAGETVATFTASDLDGDDITFSITSGNDNGYFEILDNTSGVVTLTEAGETALANNALTETDYSLGVTANDGTVDSAEAFATITFDGVNDAPTVDTNVGSTQVENLAQAGETVATFTASDLDGDDITFSITSGNDNGYFEILDNTSGVVTLTEAGETALANNALTETDYSLGVTANDGTVDSAEAFATITFDGVNDAPTVDTNVGSTQVENLAQAGETVATFTASDLDGDDITFSITSGNDNGYFEILDNTSGVVTLTEAGETALANNALTETDYSLGVTANDGTVDSAEAFATITFDGVNDAPTVDTNVGSTQVENLAQAGETVATFTASDLDGDDITFSITSGNDNGYFEILDNTSGVVTLTEAGETALANNALTETDYSLGVTANDGTVDSAEAFATITFDGVNDAPTVDTNVGSTQVENLAQAGETVATFTASDLDGDDITFSITSGNDNGYFEILDNTSGVVTLTEAGETALANNALTETDYSLGVTANDGTVDSAEAFATITFDGVNDAPTVDTNVGSTQVENLAQAGETVATFTASDLDGDDITFSITSGNDNGYFEILDNTSGVVTLTEAGETALANNALTETDYSLGVTANDGTVDSAEAFATITFDGVNDAPTVDTNVGSTQVENLAQAGETVATFTASDLDGDDITFSITSGNDNGYFEILDNTSGVVTLTEAGETALANNALTETDYSLGVTANDGTVDSAEAFATITFDGVNDAPTVDTNVGSTQVENLAQAGETVATFTASDLDGDDITFSITSGNDNGYFEILDNTSGVVTLTEAGETALANNALTETDYSLGVTANDGTVDSAEAFATITFDGVNDAPTVDTNVGSTQVENLAQAGETVATFTASDLDGDDITFSITSGNDNGYFEILDNTSGVVTLTEAGETALANNALTETDYSLGVTANDGTVDSAEAFATITFDGVNDAPTVDTNVGSTQVENLAQAGETVATFTASDLDGDDITFSITSGNDNGYFEILDNTSGVVTLTEAGETALANNALTETDYSLGVTANDGTVDSAEAFATITFDGVNDAPTVDTNVGSTQVENLAQAGETVATFTASDLDGDDITFSITSGNDNGYFEILDNTSGVVTLTEAGETALANNALTETDYSLGVTANDGTVDSAEAFATITFDGVNDAPTVDTNVGSTQVENLAQAGETVATFTASDLDGDDITFSITSGNDNGYFEILDNTSGVVTLTEAGETALANNALTETDYSLGVTANDGTVDSAEAFATITFDGVNDAPTVDTNVGSTQVENLAQAGETVATFTASDLDGDDITFSITSGNDNGYFEILDNTSGVVTLTEAGETALANNALTETDYSLGVTANDGTVDSAEAFATITFDGVNDAPTVDTNVGSTQVENLAQAGETVATFTASDLDGDDITFSITSGNDNGYFEILDNTSGVVTLTEAGETALANNALTETDYSLGVTANDGTVDSAEAFATITFDGVNDAPTVDTNVGSTVLCVIPRVRSARL
ncbi:Ig-like domain-containing protein [Marinomonas primoryensis]|uniref:Ig-like domain-containing protein n=1 Tax=Marinomonas primoryensis TaxID=178399 RepID=UPI0037044D87